MSEGYYETILDWLRTQVLDADGATHQSEGLNAVGRTSHHQ